jgi:DNA-binding transcriptional ArsR family regulator
VAGKKSPRSEPQISPELLGFIAGRFKLLAEPMRLRILHTLQRGERTVTEIIDATGATQANVSKHLAVLARAEMVGRRKEGLYVFYAITDPVIFELCDLVCNRMRGRLRGRTGGPVRER